MSVTSLDCHKCGAALDSDGTDAPTLKCRFCGTVMANPFYQPGSGSDRPAMPIININLAQNVVTGQPSNVVPNSSPLPAYVGSPAVLTESPKNWGVTLFLCLFLGLFGGHRFYTGHILVGLIQLFTLGMAGIWTLIDLVMILTGTYRDKKGLPLSGSRLSKRAGLGFIAFIIISCILLATWAESATKVDPAADHGWITGIERCTASPAFGDLVLPDNINLWENWGETRGSVISTLKHGAPVTVLEARQRTSQDVVYYRVKTKSGVKGWISGAFIQFQPLEEGVVPLEEC